MFYFDRDLSIPEIDLWLDSKRVKSFGFISHAHSDHLARHKKILCTPATADLARQRIKPTEFTTLNFGEKMQLGDFEISLHPAGHILGSAQILMKKNGTRLLYTGDFRPGSSRTVEPFELIHTDVLIMETTFGKEQYRMPPRQEVEQQLVERCHTLLKKGKIPILFAYSLGKGQEVLKILTDAGLPVAVDRGIARYVPIYRKYGVEFGDFQSFNRYQMDGQVILLPTNYRFHRYFKTISRGHTIYLSGWGMDAYAARRFGVDEVLPLSDHADYFQLLEYVDALKPQKIYCTHGFSQFVNELRANGFKAYSLETSAQTEIDFS